MPSRLKNPLLFAAVALPIALMCGSAVQAATPAAPQAPTCRYPAPAAARGAIYTDLATAPVGAWVTVYGAGFGAAGEVKLGDSAQTVVSYSASCVIFQVSGTGGALSVGGKKAGNLPVHAGRVLEAKPSNLRSLWSGAKPGDVIYLRGGNYQGIYGEGDWYSDSALETYKQGKPAQPIALVGYPGESPVLLTVPSSTHTVIALGDSNYRNRRAAHLVFANFGIVGTGDCIYGGGDTTDPSGGPDETGAFDVRLVNLVCAITDAESNTMSGMIALQGDGWKILGTTFVDPSNREVIKNNHAIYISGGADDVEVAYNELTFLHMGHVIQVHQDGRPKLYENINIHDNYLEAKNNTDMRGINVAGVDENSTVLIERNQLRNLGADFSGVAVYRGRVTVRDNDFYGIRASAISANAQHGGSLRIVASGNRFETVQGYPAVGVENGASMRDVQLTGNRYCNVAAQEAGAKPCQ